VKILMELQQYTLLGDPQTSPEHKTPTRCVRGAHYTGHRPTPEELDHLYNQRKLSVGQIARQFNVTKNTVSRWLELAGIKQRSASEAGRLRFEAQAQFVPEADQDDCLLDRAWEARPERRIRDKVACRLCFQLVSRLTGKTGHLANHHERKTGAEYARLMPGHAHDCFQHSAGSNQLDVEKLMDDWCAKWATAEEIRTWRRDPELARSKEYIGCLECGRKIFAEAEIQRHTKLVHKWSLPQYRERYPGAPTASLNRRAMLAKISKALHADRKAKLARLEQLESAKTSAEPKGNQQPKLRGETKFRVTLAGYLFAIAPDTKADYSVARELFPKQNVLTVAYDNTVKFLKRHRQAIEQEKARLLALSTAERECEAESVRFQLASQSNLRFSTGL
jgi:transposase-like protein